MVEGGDINPTRADTFETCFIWGRATSSHCMEIERFKESTLGRCHLGPLTSLETEWRAGSGVQLLPEGSPQQTSQLSC